MIRRPSIKEIFNKIKGGKESVEQGNIQIVEPAVIAGDAVKLGYRVKKLESVLFELLGGDKNRALCWRPSSKKIIRAINKGL